MAVLGTQGLSLLSSHPQAIRATTSSRGASCAIPSFCGLRGDAKAKLLVDATVPQCSAFNKCVVMPVASLDEEEDSVAMVSRRGVLAATSAALSLGGLVGIDGNGSAALADETISSWEQVTLPVDAGVVLLDMAFVPEQPNRGSLIPSPSF